MELSGEERIKNVAGAFALRRPDELKDLDVLLIDDVFTAGATMNECARVRKDAGASRVTALAIARAVYFISRLYASRSNDRDMNKMFFPWSSNGRMC